MMDLLLQFSRDSSVAATNIRFSSLCCNFPITARHDIRQLTEQQAEEFAEQSKAETLKVLRTPC